MNWGSGDSLNSSTRCGLRPKARQILDTADCDIPVACAIERVDLEADSLGEKIVAHLREHKGISTLTDKSPPEEIYQTYGVSKANYKKALGRLYKQRRIEIGDSRITLL